MLPLLYLSVLSTGTCLAYAVVRLYQANTSADRGRTSDPLGPLRPVVRLLGRVNRRVSSRYSQRSRQALRFAGLHHRLAPEEFLAIKELAAVVAVVPMVLLGWCSVLLLVVAGLVGFFYPDLWLDSKVKERRQLLVRQLPFFLDFLVVAMRAGSDFRRGIQLAADELDTGPVPEEIREVLHELQLGTSLSSALRGFASRVRMPEVSSLVSGVIQNEKTGASMQEVLGAQADQLRSQRFLLAEKRAGEAPVKMVFPLILLILPCLLIVTLAPVVVEVVLSLKGWR